VALTAWWAWPVRPAATASTGQSTSGIGVFGDSDSSYGVVGVSCTTYGVYSVAPPYVNGNLDVIGTLSKGGGSFKIDHPLDPANSSYITARRVPDMKNVYDGVVTLDSKGEATVTLPDWFEALNRDFRYQLTAMGSSAPDLYVKSE